MDKKGNNRSEDFGIIIFCGNWELKQNWRNMGNGKIRKKIAKICKNSPNSQKDICDQFFFDFFFTKCWGAVIGWSG